MLTNKVPIKFQKFLCEKCNYNSSRESQYLRHCLTAKHKHLTDLTRSYEKVQESSIAFTCNKCNKKYKSRMGLWQHSKNCNLEPSPELVVTENPVSLPIIDASLVLELIKQNKELQNVIVQQSEVINKLAEREPANNNINTINGNVTNNNQKFNLNFFLNETCKDAMTIQEFLDSIHITFEDLLLIGNSGFVNGVSDILIKQLRDIEVSKRPIHCTDSKRDTIYLKENAVWNKDDKDKTKLKQIIEKIEYRNVIALRDWCDENPDARVNNTPNNILKDKIYLQTLQGDDKTRDKIIKIVSREVIVEKE